MWLGLLGSLTVRDDRTELPAGTAKQRIILAALGLRPRQVVPLDELCGALWDASPPPAAAVTVRNHVKRLRQALGPAVGPRVATRTPGYLLDAGPDEVDVLVFADRCQAGAAALRADDWQRAADVLGEALALWRGGPLTDVPSESLHREQVPRLEHMWVQAVERRNEARLNLGQHGDLIGELHALVARHPLREAFHGQLMAALYRAGQQGEALAAYQRARQVLVAELGVEPGPALQALHQHVLAGEPAPPAVPVPGGQRHGSPATAGVTVPQQLPASVPHFAGRKAEQRLLWAAAGDPAEAAGAVAICAISGMAGVGKTTLALHWAHRAAARFPDGQLYANLRGFSPSGEPVAADAAIRGFLEALGVPAEQIPVTQDGRAGLYRSLLAGKRMLLILDNAHDEDQVRPLLPASRTCLVVVTSRTRLTSLVAIEEARLIDLDVVTGAEAREMLAARLGAGRVATQPAAVAELIGRCGRLPLALAIAAARASSRPRLPLAALAAELGGAEGQLGALDAGDAAANVRAVFSWSCDQLSPPAARMFRLLGLHPGPDISLPAAASLAGLAPAEAAGPLAELTRFHLVSETVPGRYGCHDLLRAYAGEQARTIDGGPGHRDATGRMLDHYLHTAHAGVRLFSPLLDPVVLPPPLPGVTPEPLASHPEALAWFEAELPVLFAVTALAADAGLDRHTWQLPWVMSYFLCWRGYWHEEAAIQRPALAAATRLGDVVGRAAAHRALGYTCIHFAAYDQAAGHLHACLELYRRLGSRSDEALAHNDLSEVAWRRGRPAVALSHLEHARILFEATGNRAGHAAALNNIGWYTARLGDHERGRALCQQALTMQQELGHRHAEAITSASLGYAEHNLGDSASAVRRYEHALRLLRELGDRYNEATVLDCAGDGHHAAGDAQAARRAWQDALAILEGLHHPDAGALRAKLGRGRVPDSQAVARAPAPGAFIP